VAHRFHDASVPRHIVEKLQVMGVHVMFSPETLVENRFGGEAFCRVLQSVPDFHYNSFVPPLLPCLLGFY
jgi:hypothetical protein